MSGFCVCFCVLLEAPRRRNREADSARGRMEWNREISGIKCHDPSYPWGYGESVFLLPLIPTIRLPRSRVPVSEEVPRLLTQHTSLSCTPPVPVSIVADGKFVFVGRMQGGEIEEEKKTIAQGTLLFRSR